MDNIEKDLRKIICNLKLYNQIEDSMLHLDSSLVEDLSLDSILLMQFVIEIEETFDFEFEDDMLDFHSIIYFEDLINYVRERKVNE
jgi:acyl carrier protein